MRMEAADPRSALSSAELLFQLVEGGREGVSGVDAGVAVIDSGIVAHAGAMLIAIDAERRRHLLGAAR